MNKKKKMKICSLDIETSKTNFAVKENCEIAVVGIKIFEKEEDEFIDKGYQSFFDTKEDYQKLEQFLNDFDGIIIGHNIFDFDYRVLAPKIDLRKVISKSADTLHILAERNKLGLRGLSLNNLAKLNLNLKKTFTGGSVADLWKSGNYSAPNQ